MGLINKDNSLKPNDWPMMLVKPDEWFYGPDGLTYHAVYGPVDIGPTEAVLGFEAKGNANYFVAVGQPGKQVIFAGCRVHYMMMCPEKPTIMKDVLDLSR